jgi:hypothetical protein
MEPDKNRLEPLNSVLLVAENRRFSRPRQFKSSNHNDEKRSLPLNSSRIKIAFCRAAGLTDKNV